MYRLREARRGKSVLRQSILVQTYLSMPAVQLARLRQQIARLGDSFHEPHEFRRELEGLLEHYGDLTYHRGEEILESGQLKSFNISPLVMRQLEIELSRLSGKDIQANFDIIDGIWKSDYREMRQIAIHLLGRIAGDQPRSYFATLKRWSQPGEDPTILAELFQASGEKVRASEPEAWLALVDAWCHHKNFRVQEIGLLALQPFLKEKGLEHLPEIFSLLESLLLETPLTLQKQLLVICQQLYETSQTETLVYFKQLLGSGASLHFLRLLRRLIPSVIPEDQEKIKTMLPKTMKSLPGKL